MKSLIFSLLMTFCVSQAGAAGANYFGGNVSTGIPYVSQYGLNFVSSSGMFSIDLSYSSISISAGLATASLTKPEINLKLHPFGGSFFLGVGLGQQTLSSTATDTATSQTAKVDIVSTTLTPNLGWMWGASNGGFFMGMDFGLQTPSSPTTTITSSLPTTNQAYLDAVDQGNKLGETALPVITLIRLGYLF